MPGAPGAMQSLPLPQHWDLGLSLELHPLWFLCQAECGISHGKAVVSVAVAGLWGLEGVMLSS